MLSSKRQSGFTVIELLVVIAIIVLLVAMLFPVFAYVRSSSRQAASLVQITQMGTSINAYKGDFKGTPGYFDDSDLASTITEISSTENLVLSLMGGVISEDLLPIGHTNWDPTGTTGFSGGAGTLTIDLDGFAKGPIDRPGKPGTRQYGAYYAPKTNELGLAKNEQCASPGTMPEFLDVGSVGQPLLYYRKNKRGIGVKIPVSPVYSNGYFHRRLNSKYYASAQLETYTGEVFNQAGQSLLSIGSPDHTLAVAVTNPKTGQNANPKNDTFDNIKGSFVIIAPGPDGIYFSRDENYDNPYIIGWSDLDRFDDQIMSGD